MLLSSLVTCCFFLWSTLANIDKEAKIRPCLYHACVPLYHKEPYLISFTLQHYHAKEHIQIRAILQGVDIFPPPLSPLLFFIHLPIPLPLTHSSYTCPFPKPSQEQSLDRQRLQHENESIETLNKDIFCPATLPSTHDIHLHHVHRRMHRRHRPRRPLPIPGFSFLQF